MTQLSGLLSAADTLKYTDALATIYRSANSNLAAILALARVAQTTIEGDGATLYGLANADLKAQVKGNLPGLQAAFDVTRVWGGQNPLLSALDTSVRNALVGTSWNFLTGISTTHLFDQHLTRINGAWGAPATGSPTVGTLTAGYNANGALSTCTAGNAPRLVHSLIGAADYNESLPSAEATQVALSGAQNSYTYAITGTVPAGVTKVRLYRGLVGGATTIYYWLKDVPVTSGSAYPSIPLLEADIALRQDIVPAAWLSAMMTAEFAAFFALAFSGSTTFGANAGSSLVRPIVMTALSMLSPGNVLLNPSNGVLGAGNAVSSGEFGRSTITGSSAQTWVAGTIQTANNPAANVQGFAGASLLQSRVLTSLGAGATFTFAYTYFDQAHGWGSAQTASGNTVIHVTGAVGETIAIPVTSGRIVQSVTVSAVSGAATTGSVVLEAANPRF